jgi:hypothetical protein
MKVDSKSDTDDDVANITVSSYGSEEEDMSRQ